MNSMQIEKIFEGGYLEVSGRYELQKPISKSSGGIVFIKTGLVSFQRYVTWSCFPVVTIGDDITFTDYHDAAAYYQVKARLYENIIEIIEIERGQSWANAHIFMQIYKMG